MPTSHMRHHRRHRLVERIAVTFAAAALAFIAFAGAAEATAWQVGTPSDAPTGTCPSPSSSCSLRQIITAINTSPFPPETITVPAGNYTLGQGSLVITQSMAIVGAGPRATVVAEPVPADRSSSGDRVLDVQVPTGGSAPTVSISGMEVTGGTATPSTGFFGGDIRNAGTLTLSDDWITNGSAYSGGGVSNSTGSLTIQRSLISGNHSPYGGGDSGGVQNFGCPIPQCTADEPGHLVVDDSTVTGNDARAVGGIFSWNDTNNTLTVSNSTIAGNMTKDEPGGLARLPSGGGLGVGEGTERVQNSIIAGNVDVTSGITTPSNCGPIASGGITSLGHNLDSGSDCGLPSPEMSNANPLLGPLANNGGPTDTLALAASSPAIDQVPATGANCPSIDQRGIPRPQGPACDIGAFELSVAAHCSDVSAQTPAGGGVVSIALSCAGSTGLTYVIVTPPADGKLDVINQADGTVNYTPNVGFHGTDSFSYDAVDAAGPSNTATATITVPPAAPSCAALTLTVPPGSGPVSVSLQCTAPPRVTMSYALVHGPSKGTLGAINQPSGTVTYTPKANHSGIDQFSYTAMDSGGTSGTATVTVVIEPFPRLNPVLNWAFKPSRRYTIVLSLVASGVPRQASVKVACTKGCAFGARTVRPPKSRQVCKGKGNKRHCTNVPPPRLRTVKLTRLFGERHIPVKAQLTVSIVAPNSIGKVFVFGIRSDEMPTDHVTCLAPGQNTPGRGC
jgi:hypothetical protein